ncbi:hypothetical protein V6N13_027854 [Hibiscus sabdariffa]|uniref:NAC domain-containing protein n=1 Tax=Hibiscus sabdariffa TaxID=183260 RepID=A0ABR2CFS6_9ROSI
MNLSINGQSQVPPGFRFHPTEELLHYYLRKKLALEKIDLDVIPEVDLNKLEPWDLQEKCKICSTPQNDWYFFSHKDKKYPSGTRTNRATAAGFWKATGRDKIIHSGFTRIGLRKTLVFYEGRAPHGKKSDWIMHEYRLDDSDGSIPIGDPMCEDGWVVCRVFRKKSHPKSTFPPPIACSGNDMGKTSATFTHMPGLESPTLLSVPNNTPLIDQETTIERCYRSIDDRLITGTEQSSINRGNDGHHNDWVTLDRFVALQLNGGVETGFSDPSAVFGLCHHDGIQLSDITSQRSNQNSQVHGYEYELRSLSKSSSPSPLDPLYHLSV